MNGATLFAKLIDELKGLTCRSGEGNFYFAGRKYAESQHGVGVLPCIMESAFL
jgi:hypothetical protein